MSSLETYLGRRLAEVRREKGLSASQMADHAGTTRSIVTAIETGRRADLSLQELLAFARALDVSPLTLVADLQHPLAQNPLTGQSQLQFASWWTGAPDEPEASNVPNGQNHQDAVILSKLHALTRLTASARRLPQKYVDAYPPQAMGSKLAPEELEEGFTIEYQGIEAKVQELEGDLRLLDVDLPDGSFALPPLGMALLELRTKLAENAEPLSS